jgi:hypothetical protein
MASPPDSFALASDCERLQKLSMNLRERSRVLSERARTLCERFEMLVQRARNADERVTANRLRSATNAHLRSGKSA